MAWYTNKLDIFTIKWGDTKPPKSAIEVNSNGYQHTTITVKNTKTGKTGELVLIYYPKIDKVTIGSLSTDGRSKFYLTVKDFLNALEMPEDLWKSFWQGGKTLFSGFRLSIPVDAGITLTTDSSIFRKLNTAVVTPKGSIRLTYYQGQFGYPITFVPAPIYKQGGIVSKYLQEILTYAGVTEDMWNNTFNLQYNTIFTKDLSLQKQYEDARYSLAKSIKSALGYIYYPNVKKTECPKYPITGFISGPISNKWPGYFYYRYWYKTEKGDVIEFRYGTKFLFYKPTKTIYVLVQGPYYYLILSYREANNMWPDYTIAPEKPSKDILLEISPCLASQYSDYTGTYNYEYVRIIYSEKLKVYKIEVLSTGWSDGEPTNVGENIGKLIKDLESKGCVRNDEVNFNKLINDHTSMLLEKIKEFKESVVSNIVAPTHPFDINILKQNKDPEMMRDAPVSQKEFEKDTVEYAEINLSVKDYTGFSLITTNKNAKFIIDRKNNVIYQINPGLIRYHNATIRKIKEKFPTYQIITNFKYAAMNMQRFKNYDVVWSGDGTKCMADHIAKQLMVIAKGKDYELALLRIHASYPEYTICENVTLTYKVEEPKNGTVWIRRFKGPAEYDRAEIDVVRVFKIKNEIHYTFRYRYRKMNTSNITTTYRLADLLKLVGVTKSQWNEIKQEIKNKYIRKLNYYDTDHIIEKIKSEEKPESEPKPQPTPQPKPQPKPIPQPAPQPIPEPEPQHPVRPEIGEEEGGETEKGNIGPFLILGGLIALLWYIFH